MEEKNVKIDKGLCDEIEKLHYEYKALEQVVTAYFDQHMLDPDDSAVSSPIFLNFQSQLMVKYAEYERKKAEMVEQYGLGNRNWNLNFQKCEVELQ